MKIKFQEVAPDEIVSNLQTALGGRRLAKMVSFKLEGDKLQVHITKMGTSRIEFTMKPEGESFVWVLSKEKVALAHKAFKAEVLEKLISVVTKAGGEVVEPYR